VIEEGAYADILLINGDPLKDIKILTRPEENLALDHEGREDLQEHARVKPIGDCGKTCCRTWVE